MHAKGILGVFSPGRMGLQGPGCRPEPLSCSGAWLGVKSHHRTCSKRAPRAMVPSHGRQWFSAPSFPSDGKEEGRTQALCGGEVKWGCCGSGVGVQPQPGTPTETGGRGRGAHSLGKEDRLIFHFRNLCVI